MARRGVIAAALFPLAFVGASSAAVTPLRYDIDVTVNPAERGLRVAGTMEFPSDIGDRVELSLRDAFVMTAENARIERGATAGKITTWILRGGERGPLPQKVHFSVSASHIEHEDLLYVGQDLAFTTAGEKPWYPILRGHGSIGVVRFHVPAGLIVAAPGKEVKRGQFLVEFPLRFWFAAGRYTVFQKGNTIAYLLKPREDVGQYTTGIERVLQALALEFGPYRYGRFRLAEVPPSAAEAAGGFNAFGSAGGIVTRSAALDAPFNIAYYAHEIGHQWWSNVISLRADAKRGNYLMDEAMAQFASMRAVAAVEGEAAAERYRRNGYPGFHDDLFCYCGQGYLRLVAAGLDRALEEMPEDGISDRLSRNKGGLVWSMLADVVGRERFRIILRRFTRDHAFEEVTFDELLDAIERGSKTDLHWFYQQWFARTGAPSFSLNWSQRDDKVSITVTQPAPFFRVPLEVELRGALASKTLPVNVDNAESLAVTSVGFDVVNVQLDPHYRILRWTPEMRADAEASAAYLRARQLVSEGKLDEAELVLRNALQNVPTIDRYAARFLSEYGLTNFLIRKKVWIEARQHADAAIASPTRRPEILPLVYLQSAEIARGLNDRAAGLKAVQDGLAAASAAPEPAATEAVDALRAIAAKLHENP